MNKWILIIVIYLLPIYSALAKPAESRVIEPCFGFHTNEIAFMQRADTELPESLLRLLRDARLRHFPFLRSP